MTKKSFNLNILRTKGAFKINKKASFIIFKGLLMKQITQFFWKVDSPTLKLMSANT